MYVYNVPVKQLGTTITALIAANNSHAALYLLKGHTWLNYKTQYIGISPQPIAGLAKWQVKYSCAITHAALMQWAALMYPLALNNARNGQANTYPTANSLFNGNVHGLSHNSMPGYWLFNMPATLPPMPGL